MQKKQKQKKGEKYPQKIKKNAYIKHLKFREHMEIDCEAPGQ